MTLVWRRTCTPDDQLASRFVEVPFEVSGQESIEVRLSYDTSAAVVDLGCLGPHGWVGWSGGARTSYVITRTAATPGYLAGIEDGRWAVLLGLHRVPAAGVEVVVEVDVPATRGVEVEPARPPVPEGPRGSARGLPAPAGLTWFAGDFHTHSYHSDGTLSPAQLAAAAAGRGLDFIAVTDHNTTSHWCELADVGDAYDISLIPGQEVTTFRGHANVFGDVGLIDPLGILNA